jgi:hypothetical protein
VETTCSFSGSIPFTLGTPFQLDLESSSLGSGTFGGGNTATLRIQLFEASADGGIGTAVTTLREATTQEEAAQDAPEPSAAVLASVGLAAFCFSILRRDVLGIEGLKYQWTQLRALQRPRG